MSAFSNHTATEETVLANWRSLAAVHAKSSEQTGYWPRQSAGTGGFMVLSFIEQEPGYRRFEVVAERADVPLLPVSVEWMQRVKTGFGRTMSRLPQVFGVSRQTLYNWLKGETPNAGHEARLRELVAAADVFRERGITLTSPMLLRSISNDKNFLELMASGADGRDTAEKLVRIVRGGEASRSKLEQLLAGQRPALRAEDMGTPAFDESS